jgi:C-terminal processing protease CtpA/Prc
VKGTPLGVGVGDESKGGVGSHTIYLLKTTSPLLKAGCKKSDIIVAIAGKNVEGSTHTEVMKMFGLMIEAGDAFQLEVDVQGKLKKAAGKEKAEIKHAIPSTPVRAAMVYWSPPPGNSPGLWNEPPSGTTPKRISPPVVFPLEF